MSLEVSLGWLDIPEELQRRILLLACKRDASALAEKALKQHSSLMRVCRQWRDVVAQQPLHLRFVSAMPLPVRAWLAQTRARVGSLEGNGTDAGLYQTLADLGFLECQKDSLQELSWVEPNFLPRPGMGLLTAFSQLQSLSLSGRHSASFSSIFYPTMSAQMYAVLPPSLRKLSLRDFRYIEMSSIPSFLEELELHGGTFSTTVPDSLQLSRLTLRSFDVLYVHFPTFNKAQIGELCVDASVLYIPGNARELLRRSNIGRVSLAWSEAEAREGDARMLPALEVLMRYGIEHGVCTSVPGISFRDSGPPPSLHRRQPASGSPHVLHRRYRAEMKNDSNPNPEGDSAQLETPLSSALAGMRVGSA